MTTNAPLFNWLKQRASGILLHPTSLPGPQGCGVLDSAASRWLDFLASADIRYWQVCPLGQTGYGDSPYQCFSAFAGNVYLIDLAALLPFDLITPEELASLAMLPEDHVDFGWLYRVKWPILFRAYTRFKAQAPTLPYGDFAEFRQKHAHWLGAYSLFMALKDQYQGQPWWQWPETLRFYERASQTELPAATLECAEAQAFFQYLFFGQWQAVRLQAQQRGIEIIGDTPIFVARDSADVWSHPELFLLDPQSGEPLCVAGVPPDYFSADGQLWGNPLYDWAQHAADGYHWWLRRLQANFELCDILRIDHFRAFDTYWEIPANAQTAREGSWKNGPGLPLFSRIAQTLPEARLIAEDLGDLLPSVHALRDATGLPGMVILQFAFGGDAGNTYLPHNHHANCVVYPGTHDNDTTTGWYLQTDNQTQDHLRRYLRVAGDDIAWDFIRSAYASVCKLAVIPAQDLLMLDSSARFNTPGEATGNWQWRYQPEQLEKFMQHSAPALRELGLLYGRNTFQ